MTILKEIPGFNGDYLASSDGFIYSNSPTYRTTYKGKSIVRSKKTRKIGGSKLSKKGYLRVNMQAKVYFVHTLIALTFLQNEDPSKNQVNHIDGNKLNNNINNLEWVSNSENREHAVKNKLHAFGETLSKKLTENDVREIRRLCSEKVSQRKIAKKFGIIQQTVSSIYLKKSWKHVTD